MLCKVKLLTYFNYPSLKKKIQPSMAQTDFSAKNPIRHTITPHFVWEHGMSHLAMAGFFYIYLRKNNNTKAGETYQVPTSERSEG